MKKIVFFIILSASVIFFACKVEEPPSPIFHDVKQITITESLPTLTFHDVPPEVVYLVIGFFNGSIQISEDNFVNDSNLMMGSRTGLGLNRSSFNATTSFVYQPATKDFTGAVLTPSVGYKYAIWGYNSSGVLIAGSGEYTY